MSKKFHQQVCHDRCKNQHASDGCRDQQLIVLHKHGNGESFFLILSKKIGIIFSHMNIYEFNRMRICMSSIECEHTCIYKFNQMRICISSIECSVNLINVAIPFPERVVLFHLGQLDRQSVVRYE